MASSSLLAHWMLIGAASVFFVQPAKKARTVHHRHTSPPVSQDIQPSTEIDQRVADEAAKGKQVLEQLNAGNFLENPYIVSAVYYHDNFLADFVVDRSTADPERRIIGQISRLLTPELKVRFVRLLDELWMQSGPSTAPVRFVEPVDYKYTSSRRSHRQAIDLFTAAEGVPVFAASRGVVILADRNWTRDDLFSTTSRRGGNAVIIFNPDDHRFYRYCHLSQVAVWVRQRVAAGDTIGAVGHTGLNASRPGHGQHLHFEVNEYANGHVRAIDYAELRQMVRRWRTTSSKD